MSDEVQELIGKANRAAISANQKRLQQVKFISTSTVFHNGGEFRATPEFISGLVEVVRKLSETGKSKTVIPDVDGRPINIEDVEGFLEDIRSAYQEAINEFYFSETRKTK